MITPLEGSYMPRAWGPRVCPGKKFSQVEFVAEISCLLGKHRVKPVLGDGESERERLERLLGVVDDSDMETGINVEKPEELRVRWAERI